MTWVRIDDGAPLHPKLLTVGPEAAWLWVAGLAHCNRSTTNGRIDKVFLPALYPSGHLTPKKLSQLSAELVSARLWIDEGDHFQVHEYEIQQEMALKEEVEARRKYERERKASKRREKHDRATGRDLSGTPSGTTAGQTAPARNVSPTPGPSRPVPARPGPSVHDPRATWVAAVYASWKAMAGTVPGTGSADKLAHAWDEPWRLTPQERATLERLQAIRDVLGEDVEVLKRTVTSFEADDFARQSGFSFALFAKQVASYAARREHVAGVSDFSHVPDGEGL